MDSKNQKILNEQVLNEIETEQQKNDTVEKSDNAETVETKTEIMDLRDERISHLEEKLTELQNSLRDAQLRAHAEIENTRRRTEQDIEKVHKFAIEKFAIELLPVIDSLERALEISDKNNPELSAMIEGIELTLKSLLAAMYKFGIEVVSKTNVPFNPDIHQAVSMLESDEVMPNYVMMIMQRGYTLNGRLLRPAMVTVAKVKN